MDITTLREHGLEIGNMPFPSLAHKIKNRTDEFFAAGRNLGPVVNVAGLKEGQLDIHGALRPGDQSDDFYVSEALLAEGVNSYRNLTHGRSLMDPLEHIPEILTIMANQAYRDTLTQYLGGEFYWGYVKLRRFFVNNLPDFDTTLWHYDDNASRMAKLIVYLSDINDELDGPFCFVPGSPESRPRQFPPIEGKYSISEDELVKVYGPEQLHPVFGEAGSVVLADTTGWHRGSKPTRHDRYVLYINAVLEPEYGGKGPKPRVKKSDVLSAGLSLREFDFFDLV